MRKSSKKPTWPHKHRTTMTAHPNGQWCKKILGKVKMFGVWADPDGALKRYMDNQEDLHNGVDVQTTPGGGVTVADVFNQYLASRKPDIDAGRRDERADNNDAIGPAMFRRYVRAAEIVAKVVGGTKLASTLKPADFARVMTHLKEQFSAGTLTNYVGSIKTVFEWAASNETIPNRLNFGTFAGAMSVKTARRKRLEGRRKLLDAEQVRKLLSVANPHVRAMVRLSLNCGFYAIDCSDLRITDLDLPAAMVEMERHKSNMPRKAALWPETVTDLKAAIASRPTPNDDAHADRVFITQRGNLWVKTQHANYDEEDKLRSVTHNDYVAQEFIKLFAKAKIERPKSCTFAWLRHTFYTIARRTRLIDAVNLVMGHAAGGMTEHYLEDVDDADLKAVSGYVRAWLMDDKAAVVAKIG